MRLAQIFILVALAACSTAAATETGSKQDPTPVSETASRPGATTSRLVRDPTSGRLFREDITTVQVPTRSWTQKPVTKTVYQPEWVTSYVDQQQVVYEPRTRTVLRQRVVGVWNPFRQPAVSYEYVPVTEWVPTTKTGKLPVVRQQLVPRQQTVYVPEPTQGTSLRKSVSYTEIPQPGAGSQPGVKSNAVPTGVVDPRLYATRLNAPSTLASQQQPLIRIPILAKQKLLPSRPQLPYSTPQPSSSMLAGRSAQPALQPSVAGVGSTQAPVGSRLRKMASNTGLARPTYTAPLRTASAASSSVRDLGQAGMSATVLR